MQGETDLAELLGTAARALRRRAMVFVVSDFISQPGWEHPLTLLAQRHDVVAVLTRPDAAAGRRGRRRVRSTR